MRRFYNSTMSSLKVHNSYTRQKENFVPITEGHVGMYVCGPTVSGESHLGHARGFITFDFIFRYLIYLGYKVRYVRNITDAGHFEEEGREAEDKIRKKAAIEKIEPMELVQKYFIPFRSFDLLDILADGIGCVAGYFYAIKRFSAR